MSPDPVVSTRGAIGAGRGVAQATAAAKAPGLAPGDGEAKVRTRLPVRHSALSVRDIILFTDVG